MKSMATWRLAVLVVLWAGPLCAESAIPAIPAVRAFTVEEQKSLAKHPVIRVAHATLSAMADVRFDKVLESFPAAERMQLANRWTSLDDESERRSVQALTIAVMLLVVACVALVILADGCRKAKGELTLRRRTQAELERTRDELARTSQEKTELLQMVAHDLRNPLTSLMLNTETLTYERRLPDAETLSDMKSSIDRMRSLVALLVDRQALERGRRVLKWTRIDPGKETVAAIAAVSEAAKRKGIDVIVRAEPELPQLESDQGAFRQVVDNLVSNAVKYAPSGSSVRVDVAHTSQVLRIAVRDQGPGVPPAERTSIFKEYQVGSARPTGGEASTGLGLWIVSRIVEEMKGRVWCEGERGEGSVFVVEFPFVTSHGDQASA